MKIEINVNQVKYDTGKAMLITIPRTKSWKFWMPSSLVYANRDGFSMSVYVPESMDIHCVDKNGKKFEMPADQLTSYFQQVSIGKKQSATWRHKPDSIDPKDVDADEELMR